HGGPTAVAAATSQLTTAQGLGAVAGALLLAPLAARIGRGPLLGWSLALLPIALTGYALAPSRWWGIAGLFIVGMVYLAVLPRPAGVLGPGHRLFPGGARRHLSHRRAAAGPSCGPRWHRLDDRRVSAGAGAHRPVRLLALARLPRRPRRWGEARAGRDSPRH